MRKGFCVKLLAAGLMVVLVAGCATMGGGAKDQKAVEKTLADWKAALEKGDVAGMMAFYSESFTTDRGNTKAELQEFFQGAKDQGYLDGATADLTAAEIKIEEGAANVGPITLSSDAGSLQASLVLKKEADKAWRIVSSEMNQ
jgi:ketosteroid isomerase-like protein